MAKQKKVLDLSRSVYDLTTEYPELIDTLAGLGFTEITKPAMRASVGRLMTIPKGATAKGINMGKVVMKLMMSGYTLAGEMPTIKLGDDAPAEPADADSAAASEPQPAAPSRTEQIKGYLRRLGAGEDLEAVRAEFAQEFAEVDAQEIMDAEQELMREGTPLEEVQRLCDVHSALFHGSTCGDNASAISNAAAAVEELFAKKVAAAEKGEPAKPADPIHTPGHPLNTLTRENEALAVLLKEANAALEQAEDGEDAYGIVAKIKQIAIHYAKKGDLLYPVLNVRYGIDGPSKVMWTVDDEIRDELGRLCRESELDHAWMMAVGKVLARAEEMIYKESNILFPICLQHFTAEEWHGIYRDGKDYAVCLGVEPELWDEGEKALDTMPAAQQLEGEVVMPGGHMTVPQLTAMLNTLPLEISFVDADNINRFFNEGPKVFKRPMAAIDREVFSCHPPKIEPMVRAIIDDFRYGTRDVVPVWMEKNGRTMLVQYMAVRSAKGEYLGTVEVVQDMEFAREHFSA